MTLAFLFFLIKKTDQRIKVILYDKLFSARRQVINIVKNPQRFLCHCRVLIVEISRLIIFQFDEFEKLIAELIS